MSTEMAQDFVIETGIPIPSPRRKAGTFNFLALKPDGSNCFTIQSSPENLKKDIQTVRNAIYAFTNNNRKGMNTEFKTRTDRETCTIRIWRTR